MDFENLQELFYKYPIPTEYTPTYGTSGFRTDAKMLDGVVLRAAMMMVLRSKQIGGHCGIMVTASHNPENDNGLKLVDYTGDMIDEVYEKYATQLARCKTFLEFQSVLNAIINENNIDIKNSEGCVLIGQDTRTSGDNLVEICKAAISTLGGKYVILGKVTTPELHYNVATYNSSGLHRLSYIENLILAFNSLYKSNNLMELHVDCANGVGAIKMIEIKELLRPYNINVSLYNTGDGKLNHICGADYVEKTLNFPTNMQFVVENAICCSLDGDADRIVFFTKTNGNFVLLNGDKIACLIVSFLCNQYEDIQTKTSICVVHTPYANGSFVSYIQNTFPFVNIQCAETGVKNLHRTAKKYDVGLYFESNGHGSVHFSENALKNKHISVISKLLSQYTGDALGDLLFVLVALQQTSFQDWISMYEDFPCKQVKLYGDKSLFETTDFGRKLTQPVGIQDKIDKVMNKYSRGNCFVRPSGTEDVLRLYVECHNNDQISNFIADIVQIVSTYTNVIVDK